MELGCTLPDGFLADLEHNYLKFYIMAGAKEQIKKACKGYVNGKPYPFETLGVLDYANLGSEGIEGRIAPYAFSFPAGTCSNCGADKSPNGTDLKRCGDCKKVLYCTKLCQVSHYGPHSGNCDEDKAMARAKKAIADAKAKTGPRPAQPSGGGIMMLNNRNFNPFMTPLDAFTPFDKGLKFV
ncbi:hypothetical protein KVT40_004991 [Elsinoe batatas]|uniref:MYND-type domain-containing protein n=1 Tax=Elsinoe batatas TaxID=2601811 RepID=A0A8K0PHJ3_9PEZI|nr:hypothetical protein KVT40_004991 [Elsinoe batatas]